METFITEECAPGKLSKLCLHMFISEMGVKAQQGDLKVTLAKLFSPDTPTQRAEGPKPRETSSIIRNAVKNETKGFHVPTNFIEISAPVKVSSEGCS